MGSQLYIGRHGRIQMPSAVTIGDRVVINDHIWIAANTAPNAGIHIGSNVEIGPYVILHSGNHQYERMDLPIKEQGHSFKEINVEDDVWIAARAIVLAGVTLGKGTVVAAGAVVTRSTAPYTVVAGIPAKQIGARH